MLTVEEKLARLETLKHILVKGGDELATLLVVSRLLNLLIEETQEELAKYETSETTE